MNKMNLNSRNFKNAYSSDMDNILHDFYIPALESSVEYNRLAGFFSSTSLAIAARGIVGLIRNGGTFNLVVSPKLDKDDLKTIIDSGKEPTRFVEMKMLEELDNLENEFVRDHVFALGWMIANKKLKIRVTIIFDTEGKLLSYQDVQRNGIFHQKVGILKDVDGNIMTFSGSVNETAAGWLDNIEEFKVFRSWKTGEERYAKADITKFDRFWNNRWCRGMTMDVPQAVEKRLIEIAPRDIENVDFQRWYKKPTQNKEDIELFSHQKDAVRQWLEHDMKGIFEMATGTGKTYTALGCLQKASKTRSKLTTVITCPYVHLLRQWEKEIERFGTKYDDLIFTGSSNILWKDTVSNSLIDVSLGHKKNIIILTTHHTFSSGEFMRIIQNNKSDCDILLIADEVHGLGAEKRRIGLLEEYDCRLGLSATPKRWLDVIGTDEILSYFGDVVYEFGLKKAINTVNPVTGDTYLTPYRYVPIFVSLNTDEFSDYIQKTKVIAWNFTKSKKDAERAKFLKIMLFKRADIIKNATEKYDKLEEVFNEMECPIRWTIVYCSSQQISRTMDIINQRGLVAHRFTMDEGVKPSERYNGLTERDFILKAFAEGKYHVLVAMKCLDEGVDVPPARIAILLASSGNPREYIQRIGRVIRRYKDKREATIYDMIVIPPLNEVPLELREIEGRLLQRELKRYEEIAEIAVNNAEALKTIYEIKNKLMEGMQ